MNLELPITLEDGITIISQSEDGVLLISYPRPNGEEGLVYWPDKFKRFKPDNLQEEKAIKTVQAFIIDHLCAD